ncbi:replication initiation factor domain-containing protein, partial [Enterococcus raffinosus]
VLLEIRSAGCRFLEEQADHSWRNFFQQLMMIAKHVSIERYSIKRMDVAIDSYTKETLSPTRAESYLKKRLVTSRFRVSRTIKEYHVKTAEVTGDSIYFGRRTSDLYIIVYDKQLESDSDSCWFRVELRFRNLWGTKVMAALLGQPDTFSEFIAGVLEANIQFRSSIHKRSEVRRQPLAKWYLDYLSYVRRQNLYGLNSCEKEGGASLDD